MATINLTAIFIFKSYLHFDLERKLAQFVSLWLPKQGSVFCIWWEYTLQSRLFGSVMSLINTEKVMLVPRSCPWQMLCLIIIGSNHY